MQEFGGNGQSDEELTRQYSMERRLPPLPRDAGGRDQGYNFMTGQELNRHCIMERRLPPLPRLEYDEEDKLEQEQDYNFFEMMFGHSDM